MMDKMKDMKTKKYIFIAAAASMLGMTTSCDDEGFLTEKPKTIYTTDNSYETIDQVKACITCTSTFATGINKIIF